MRGTLAGAALLAAIWLACGQPSDIEPHSSDTAEPDHHPAIAIAYADVGARTVRAANARQLDALCLQLTKPATLRDASNSLRASPDAPAPDFDARQLRDCLSIERSSDAHACTVRIAAGRIDGADSIVEHLITLAVHRAGLLRHPAAADSSTGSRLRARSSTRAVSRPAVERTLLHAAQLAPRQLTASPTTPLHASGTYGGPFTPTSQLYTLRNMTPGPANYHRVISQPWIRVDGTTDDFVVTDEPFDITVRIDATAASTLAVGSHQASVDYYDAASNALALSLPVTLDVLSAGPSNLEVVIANTNPWRTYPPGATFSIDVHVGGDPLNGSPVVCHWVDEHRAPLGPGIPITDTPTTLQSPSPDLGFYGLVFSSSNPDVAFVPQPAGFASSVYGFAVLPDPPTGTPEIEPSSPFGIVQGDVDDPYLWSGSGPRVLGIHLKTKTWSQIVPTWAANIAERTAAGHTEMPLINGSTWNSDDLQPIPQSQVDAIGDKFSLRLAAEPNDVLQWQVGREENGNGNPYDQPFYFANLHAKMARLRAEADAINPAVRLVYSSIGSDMTEFAQLFASTAYGNFADGLANDVYRWPDFPTPEPWLSPIFTELRSRMDAAGHGDHFLWIGEIGVPVRGTNDPNAFFGYPLISAYVPGSTLDYAAKYLLKCHAITIASGVERLFVYNYKNRGDDVSNPEHFFGLRTYTGISGDPGHPQPAYVAYITMLRNLKGSTFVDWRNPTPNTHVFEFAVTNTSERRLLAWVEPDTPITLSLGALAPGLTAADVQSVTDKYGRPVTAVTGQQIALDCRLLFVQF